MHSPTHVDTLKHKVTSIALSSLKKQGTKNLERRMSAIRTVNFEEQNSMGSLGAASYPEVEETP